MFQLYYHLFNYYLLDIWVVSRFEDFIYKAVMINFFCKRTFSVFWNKFSEVQLLVFFLFQMTLLFYIPTSNIGKFLHILATNIGRDIITVRFYYHIFSYSNRCIVIPRLSCPLQFLFWLMMLKFSSWLVFHLYVIFNEIAFHGI